MKRQIVSINKELCNGCGICISGCAEGALKLIDGKAELVREILCDGFGDCVGVCPTGALKIETREAEKFDIEAVKVELQNTRGPEAIKDMLKAQKRHHQAPNHSELKQWPVQLHLVNPQAPHFMNSELLVLSTCSPIASADMHQSYIKGRCVVVACPKLDDCEGYTEKLAQIMSVNNTPKVIIAIMTVPCCKGLTRIVKNALTLSGRKDLNIEEHIINLDGTLQTINQL